MLLDELPERGIVFHAGASQIAIGGKAVTFTDRDGRAQSLPADTVIIAKGAEADTGLHDDLATVDVAAAI